jgi:DNA gyrase subunit A
MGRATQGVRLINLEKHNDSDRFCCKVSSEKEEETEMADQNKPDEDQFSSNENQQTTDEN